MRHITLSLIILFSFSVFCFSQEKSISDLRKQAAKLQKDGNWKDAFQVYESLLLERADTGQGGADDLKNAWACLSRMRQSKLVDDLLEKVVEKYPKDWRILVSAARVYNQIPKWGMMIDDEFIRESRSGGGKWNEYSTCNFRELVFTEKRRNICSAGGVLPSGGRGALLYARVPCIGQATSDVLRSRRPAMCCAPVRQVRRMRSRSRVGGGPRRGLPAGGRWCLDRGGAARDRA